MATRNVVQDTNGVDGEALYCKTESANYVRREISGQANSLIAAGRQQPSSIAPCCRDRVGCFSLATVCLYDEKAFVASKPRHSYGYKRTHLTSDAKRGNTAATTFPRTTPLPRAVRGFWFWIVASAFITLCTTYYYRHFLHLYYYPFINPWFQPYSYQFDFNCYSERIKYFHQALFFHQSGAVFNYPAVLALVYKLFYLFGRHAHTLFVSTLISCFGIGAALFARSLARHGVSIITASQFMFTVLVTSHPLGVLLYLANMEGIVWIATSLGVYAFTKNRTWSAALCFGLAGAMKIFPIAYLGLLLQKRCYRQFSFGVVVCAVVNLVSLAVLGPTIRIAAHGLSEGIKGFSRVYVYQWNPLESSMDHSLFALFKVILVAAGRLDLLRIAAGPYLYLVAIGGLVLYFAVLRTLPTINAVLALAIACVLFPQVSHDYTLVHLYAPWALLILALLNGGLSSASEKGARYMMGCFIILFTSQNYLIVNDVRFAGQIKAIVLVILLILAIRYPLRSEFDVGIEGVRTRASLPR